MEIAENLQRDRDTVEQRHAVAQLIMRNEQPCGCGNASDGFEKKVPTALPVSR